MLIVSCKKKKKRKQQEDPLGIVHDRDEAGTRHDRELMDPRGET